MESEADKEAKINMAKGDSEGITLRAEATASALKQVSEALQAKGAQDAIQLRVAEQYIDAFSQLAKETNTVIVPQNVGDAAGMVTQLMSVFKGVQQNKTVS